MAKNLAFRFLAKTACNSLKGICEKGRECSIVIRISKREPIFLTVKRTMTRCLYHRILLEDKNSDSIVFVYEPQYIKKDWS